MSQANPDKWHFAIKGQQYGPVPWAELRKMALGGKLSRNDRVWKDGMPDWLAASQIKGLFEGATPDASTSFTPPPSLQRAEQQVEKVSRRLWFLDLQFKQFATPRIIGFLWMLYLISILIVFVGAVGYYVFHYTAVVAALCALALVILMMFWTMWMRVCLEFVLVGIRIAERLDNLNYLENLKYLGEQKPNGS